MNKMLKKLTSAVFASMMFACVNAFAASDNAQKFELLTANDQKNPVVKNVVYIPRNPNGVSFVLGNNHCAFTPKDANERVYKNGSYFWVVIFVRGNECKGDFIFEYDASSNRKRVTEICSVHGVQERNVQEFDNLYSIKEACAKFFIAKPSNYKVVGENSAASSGSVKIEDLGYTWIKSTADTGYYYDEKTLRVNAAKRTVSVDACVWQPAKNMYTVLGGWTFDYNKMVSYPAWYKEVRISDGVTIKKVDGGKFGKAPFNLDNDNKVYEDFLYKFVK